MPSIRDGKKSFNADTDLARKLKYGVKARKNIYPSVTLNLFVSQRALIFPFSVKETHAFFSRKYCYVQKGQARFIFKYYQLQGRTCQNNQNKTKGEMVSVLRVIAQFKVTKTEIEKPG